MWGGAGETPPLKSKTTVLPRSLVQSRNLECRDHDSETTVSPSLKSSDAAEAEAVAVAVVEAEVEAEVGLEMGGGVKTFVTAWTSFRDKRSQKTTVLLV